jgi:three-Cys-motif partner protein
MSQADPNPDHWADYTNLQRVKHDLVREYLNGWFPKMTLGPTGCRQLQYIDTHAGKGKFRTGEPGSPLVALTTLLRHSARDQMLRNSKINFHFIEADEENAATLRGELAKYNPLPNNVCAEVEGADCFKKIEEAIAEMDKEGKRLAPAFVFVDPYTFKLPGQLLRKLLTYPQVELFVNVIWRELDMSIQQGLGRTGPADPANLGPNLFEPTPDPEQARAAAAQRRANAPSRDGGDPRQHLRRRPLAGDWWNRRRLPGRAMCGGVPADDGSPLGDLPPDAGQSPGPILPAAPDQPPGWPGLDEDVHVDHLPGRQLLRQQVGRPEGEDPSPA